MFSRFKSALTGAAFVLAGLSAPAHANVVYNFDFIPASGGGATSGQLVLNYSSVSQTVNQNVGLASILVSLTFVENGTTLTITPGNLASGSQFKTGSDGKINTLMVEEHVTAPTPALEIFTSAWQVHNGLDGGTLNQGNFTLEAPALAAPAVPEPATWAMMILGFLGVGFMAYRRKSSRPALQLRLA
jgi:hypothetical protein